MTKRLAMTPDRIAAGDEPDESGSAYLRDVVESRLVARWDAWVATHPNLARVIDRTKLIDAAVTRLRADRQFQDALEEADLDEATLAAAAGVLAVVEQWVARLMAL